MLADGQHRRLNAKSGNASAISPLPQGISNAVPGWF
jgi:hypothetical protein